MRVAVIGLGLLGAAAARSLATEGADVTVYERDRPAVGTSGTTFAWVNSNMSHNLDYHRIKAAGVAEFARLPTASGFRRSGGIHIASAASAEHLHENVSRLHELGYRAEWVTPQVAVQVAGDLRIPSNTSAIAYFPEEGYALPAQLTNYLWQEAHQHGARLVIDDVQSIGSNSNGAIVRSTASKDSTFDCIVVAAGRWTMKLLAEAGMSVPMDTNHDVGSATVGLLGYCDISPAQLRAVVHTDGLNLRPDGGTRAVVQALDLNADVDPSAPPAQDSPISTQMRRRLAQLLGLSDPAPAIALRVGFRSLPLDGLPVAGYTEDGGRIYSLVSHGGVTLAPLLGRLVAEEVLHDRRSELLTPFRPQRFENTDLSKVPALRQPVRMGEQ